MRKILCDICKNHDSFRPATMVVLERIVMCENCTYVVVHWSRRHGIPDDNPFVAEFRCVIDEPIECRVVK